MAGKLHKLLVGNDNVMELRGLRNAVSSDYMNAATVSVTIKTKAGVNVAGATWPITMTYVTSSTGNYRGTIPAALEIVHGREYLAVISATMSGTTARWDEDVLALNRDT